MARIIALAHTIDRADRFELVRAAIVMACALALIVAGDALPRLP